MANLAYNPKKIWRARQEVMVKTRDLSEKLNIEVPIRDTFVEEKILI